MDIYYVLNINGVVFYTATSAADTVGRTCRGHTGIGRTGIGRSATGTPVISADVSRMYLFARGEEKDIGTVVGTCTATEMIDVHAEGHPKEEHGESYHCDM